MPIRTKPFDSIDGSDLRTLVERGTQEDATIEFKQDFSFFQAPPDSVKRHEFLKDVTAMANAYGGTIVYGVAQGTGTEEGVARKVTPFKLPGSADDVSNKIDGILDTGIDERIVGIRSKGIEVEKGKHCWVIRVPPSHLAPHFVTRVCSKPKPNCYQRQNTTNVPLDARGIKEIALKAESARQRAKNTIVQRVDFARRVAMREAHAIGWRSHSDALAHGPYQVLLHFIPLYPSLLDLEEVADKANELELGSQKYSFEGLYCTLGGRVVSDEYRLFLRDGGLEFQSYSILYRGTDQRQLRLVAGKPLLDKLRNWLTVARDNLAPNGLLIMPCLVSVSLVSVEGSYMPTPDGISYFFGPLEQDTITVPPWILHEWGAETYRGIRRMLDTVWQSYGLPRCTLWGAMGQGFLPPEEAET